MSRTTILAFLALIVLGSAVFTLAADVDEKDVVVLTDKNFDEVIAKGTTLVEFYAPWCGHCKQLTPHYAEAATKLKADHPEVALAKIDADSYKEIGTKYGVQGFPTLKWFVNGKATEYNGGRTADTIVSWIKKRMGPATTNLATAADFDKFKDSANVVVVGFFKAPEGDAWKTFESVAAEFDEVSLGAVHGADVMKHAGHKDGDIVLYKKFDEGKAVYSGEMKTEDIKSFISVNQLAYVNEFSPESSGKIFGSPVNKQVLLFADKKGDKFKEQHANFEKFAKEFYGKVVGVYVTSETSQVMDYFGVTAADIPCVFAVKVPSKEEGGSGMKKFKGPEKDDVANEATMKKFFDDFVGGSLRAHVKSEKEPEQAEDEHGVTTLVGHNFDKIINQDDKDALVEFYAPWCGHCKQLAPIWDKLGEEFKQIPSVVIAKMDTTANDPPEHINIQGFPTIKFFKAGSDKSKPTDYEGDRTLKGFKKFLKNNAGVEFNLPKKDKKKKPASAEL